MLADFYPPDARVKVFSAHRLASSVGQILGPILAAESSWRWGGGLRSSSSRSPPPCSSSSHFSFADRSAVATSAWRRAPTNRPPSGLRFAIPGVALILPLLGAVSDAFGIQASVLVLVPVSIGAGLVLASAACFSATDIDSVRRDSAAGAGLLELTAAACRGAVYRVNH